MCEIIDVIVFVLLGICSISDWKKKTLPVSLLFIFSLLVAVFIMICRDVDIWQRVIGALIGVLFLCISKFTKEAVGYGDSWLILLLGVYLGGLRAMEVLFAAALLAGLVSVFFLWNYHWKKTKTLPFVPFLWVSYLGVLVF